ncbi:hypothetical protein J1N35_002377 [Gossypium stocksii]|uniref:Uncharacterized protein n=1 Tax=Gossypium stocksii TaxID=47602 RepID=A0A9D4ANF6_9ROSI|nr:hypothetical protein J1N35_002377 [Gossypium stocksii]
MESMTTPTYNVIKSKLLIARFILTSSCRMGLSSLVFWTKDKLCGKIFEGKEIKVNWEIQPIWDDIIVMRRHFPFTRYCGNDTKALYQTCNEATKEMFRRVTVSIYITATIFGYGGIAWGGGDDIVLI